MKARVHSKRTRRRAIHGYEIARASFELAVNLFDGRGIFLLHQGCQDSDSGLRNPKSLVAQGFESFVQEQ